MSLTDILVQIQNKFPTSVHGGMNVESHILTFIIWYWITLLYQVCLFNYTLFLSTNILPTFLATSVDVEQVFSQGCIILLHLRSQLSVQSIRTLICIGEWSCMGYIKGSDFRIAVVLPEVSISEKESGLVNGWDSIVV
jgi:hypothetical protein